MATPAAADDPPNPARLSTQLAGLFPPGVVATELCEPAAVTLLSAAEFQSISHCAGKRIQDFTAGRACARRALRELGVTGFSLLAGPNRQPLWPPSVVGSITHTHGYCGAVVARHSDLLGIGVDCEVADAVTEELWPGICAPSELERLAHLPAAARRPAAALIFAAKEAFYKCQFPLTNEWVGFEDVVIEPAAAQAGAGIFKVVARKALGLDAAVLASLLGRFHFRDRWVIAGIAAPGA